MKKIKLSELCTLMDMGVLLKALFVGWDNTHQEGGHTAETKWPRVAMLAFLGISGIISMIAFLIGSPPRVAAIDSVYWHLISFSALFIGIVWLSDWWLERHSELCRDTNELVERLHDGAWCFLFEIESGIELVQDTENRLLEFAEDVCAAERNYGTLSEEAESTRLRFKNAHAACRKFDLGNEKWDGYFAKAKARLETKPEETGTLGVSHQQLQGKD